MMFSHNQIVRYTTYEAADLGNPPSCVVAVQPLLWSIWGPALTDVVQANWAASGAK